MMLEMKHDVIDTSDETSWGRERNKVVVVVVRSSLRPSSSRVPFPTVS